ncbi:lipid-A-disaccharide synthase [candidate division KSB1 bacterium]|nr:lipid-A-disaccharide synthase [candidate division KSB1 bacterium]RQW00219.1 MAG: lipid-A-disaccharide synthase [candidate division KSB1 bacterium]
MVRRILMVAGEASGDLHGGKLVRALNANADELQIFGVGGDHMADAGMELLFHVADLAYVGFSEIIKHLPHFKRVFDTLIKTAIERKPDVVVLIDYPGFNLRIGKKLKALGFTIFYFIAPQVWAWHRRRAQKMASFIDRMAVIFDFEVEFFSTYGIDTHFVGHPLVDSLSIHLERKVFFQKFNLDPQNPILALFPGSRKQEITNLLPDMLVTAQHLRKKYPHLQIAAGLADTISSDMIKPYVAEEGDIKIIKGATFELMAFATAGIVASGTATLEAGYFQLPFVLLYRVSSLSYFLGKRLIKIPHIGLVNIVGQEELVKEYIQGNIHPASIAIELEKCLFDEPYRELKISRLSCIKQKLGERGAAERTAALVLGLIKDG